MNSQALDSDDAMEQSDEFLNTDNPFAGNGDNAFVSDDEDDGMETPSPDGEGGFVLKGRDGKELRFDSEEEAWEFASKGQDATKKWQEAAQLRKEADALREQAELWQQAQQMWEQDPQGFVRTLAEWAGQQDAQPRDQYGRFTKLDEESLTENERALALQNQELRAQLEQVKQFLPELQETVQMTRSRFAAEAAALKIGEQYGVQVAPLELQKAMQDTGISDPAMAWKAANFDRVRTTGPQRKAPEMPETKKSRVIPKEQFQQMSEFDIFRAIQTGATLPDYDPERELRRKR